MAIDPERNDVDISKLFHWGNKFEVIDKYGNKIIEVYMRLVGDSDVNRARTYALRRSSEMRKALKTPGTDAREAFISTIFDVEDPKELRQFLRALHTRQVAQEAAKTVRVPLPKEPRSDASLEEQEIYQAQVDTYPQRREEEFTKYMLHRLNEIEKELEDKPLEVLQKRYERMMTDELCEQEMIETFREYCVYLSIYLDPKFRNRLFEMFDDFENLPTDIKTQYKQYYDTLEINVDELKKSLGVTQ